MYVYADNVVEESTTTTNGAYQLGGVPASGQAPGVRTWVAGVGNANASDYYAYEVGGTAWERGLGTVTDAAPDTLTRTTIYSSSNADAAVDWTGKTVRIRCISDNARHWQRDSPHLIQNLSIVTSRAGNAETIALKTAAGADPTPGDPIRIAFRDATAGSGDFTVLEITAATSIVISSGSTLGATSATAFRLWLVAFNDAGTFRLGVIKCALTDGIYGLQDNVLESSTAEGGAGAADSSGVIYTGTAVAAKAMRVLGYLEYTLTTSGTWVTAPSLVQIYSHGARLPGETVQSRVSVISALQSIATAMPLDDTIPQNTEGAEVTTIAITPKSATSMIVFSAGTFGAMSGGGTPAIAIFRDSIANAIAVQSGNTNPSAGVVVNASLMAKEQSPGTSQVTYKMRVGLNNTNTFYLNGLSAARLYGGAASTYFRVEEIAA
jgi:hypothetical protein